MSGLCRFALLLVGACSPATEPTPPDADHGPAPLEVPPAAPAEVSPPAPSPTGLAAPISALAPGVHHTCALRGGQVFCWGYNRGGLLGVGEPDLEDILTPRPVQGLDRVVEVVADYDFTCAVDDARAVYCWGDNADGQLGSGDLVTRGAPAKIADLAADRVYAGFKRACAVAGRDVRCWGTGPFGDGGNRFRQQVPRAVTGLGRLDELSLGDGHACLLDAGAVRCWGHNASGQLGNGAGGCRYERERCPHSRCLPDQECPQEASPVRAVGLPKIVEVVTAGSFTLARDEAGVVWSAGQQGVTMDLTADAEKYRPRPVAGLPAMVEVDGGSGHFCGRTAAGELWCWGNDAFGQLGHPPGPRGGGEGPARVEGLVGVTAVALGFHSSCALTGTGADAAAWCWGDNGHGQLGDGTSERRHRPVQVRWQ